MITVDMAITTIVIICMVVVIVVIANELSSFNLVYSHRHIHDNNNHKSISLLSSLSHYHCHREVQ